MYCARCYIPAFFQADAPITPYEMRQCLIKRLSLPLSMWMESTVGITLPFKDWKIADFSRKEPRTLS